MIDRFAGKTVLLTGSSGFLGRHFKRRFKLFNEHSDEPVKVLCVDNHILGTCEVQTDPDIFEIGLDVTLPLHIREPIHYFISAAGIASPVHYMKHPIETIGATIDGVRNMLDLARRNPVEGFLYFSSSEIYGDPVIVPTPETYLGYVSCTGPRACYDESKRMGETICVVNHQQFGIPVKIVRPFNVFGPGMAYNDRRVVPMFTYEAFNNRPLPVFAGGDQTRTFCYIDDAIDGFLKVLLDGRPGEAYNIGNEQNEISMVRLAGIFEGLIPGAEMKQVEYPAGYPQMEPQRRCPDLTKAHKELGYWPKVSLQEGIERFIEWAAEEPSYFS